MMKRMRTGEREMLELGVDKVGGMLSCLVQVVVGL